MMHDPDFVAMETEAKTAFISECTGKLAEMSTQGKIDEAMIDKAKQEKLEADERKKAEDEEDRESQPLSKYHF